MVGVVGFEPTTLCSQSRCASQAALHSVISYVTYTMFDLGSQTLIWWTVWGMIPGCITSCVGFNNTTTNTAQTWTAA
jgi:hypothetical protein